MSGGKSIWQVKKASGFKASVLMPVFSKLLGKPVKDPTMTMPAKAAKEERQRRAA